MNILSERDKLNAAIMLLQVKRSAELQVLKEQAYDTYESLRPVNLIKNTLKDLSSSTAIKNGIAGDAMAITTGFLSKKLLVGGSHNPFKRLVGTIVQFAIGNLVSNHSGGIMASGENLLHWIIKKRNASKKPFQHNGQA